MKGKGLGVGRSPLIAWGWAGLRHPPARGTVSKEPQELLLPERAEHLAVGHVLPRLHQPPGQGLRRRRAHAITLLSGTHAVAFRAL